VAPSPFPSLSYHGSSKLNDRQAVSTNPEGEAAVLCARPRVMGWDGMGWEGTAGEAGQAASPSHMNRWVKQGLGIWMRHMGARKTRMEADPGRWPV
jgi:hypothetical protein